MSGAFFVQRHAWTPQRAELERILADDEWHSVARLTLQMAPFVDPRLAARTWYRDHRPSRYGNNEDETVGERFARNEREAIAWGRRAVCLDMVRTLISAQRLEIRGHRSYRHNAWTQAEVRVSPAVREREALIDATCRYGHPKPDTGWPSGKRKNCLPCNRLRHERRQQRCADVAAD